VRVFESRVLMRTAGSQREEMAEAGENFIMKGFTVCILHKILLG
jgi:hypothetical protein